MPKVDPVLEAIGGRGRYQILMYFLSTMASLSASFQLLNIVFVGRQVPHVCKQPANLSDIYSVNDNEFLHPNNSVVYFEKCKIRLEGNISGTPYSSDLPCLYGYQYEEKKDTSLMSDMDIVCDRAPLRGLGQTLLILGQGIGALTLPVFSDRYGRRTVLLISHACFLAIGVGIAFAPDFTSFLVMRVFLGIVQQGIVTSKSTISIEMFSTQHRKFAGLLGSLIWTFCSCLIPLVAYVMESYSWRYTQLAYCSVSLYVIIQFLFLDESLFWLITNRKTKQVEKNLKKAARISGKDCNTVLEAYRKYQEDEDKSFIVPEPIPEQIKTIQNGTTKSSQKVERQKDKTKPTFLELMKRKRLALTVFVLWFTWLTDSMTFFGLFMTSHSLYGNRYINFFLYSLVDAPAVLVFYFMVDRYGRKKTSMTLHGIGGAGLILATVVKSLGKGNEWAETAVTVLSCVGMFGASGAWGVSFFFTPEMFPTNLRNFGLGTSSSFSRLGGMLAPFSSLLAEYVPWAPGAIFGSCCIIVTVLVNFLPETMGRELPQTLDDMEAWYKKDPDKKFDDVKMKDIKVQGLAYKETEKY